MGFGDGESITRPQDPGWASGTVSQTDKDLIALENTGIFDSQRQQGGAAGLNDLQRDFFNPIHRDNGGTVTKGQIKHYRH